MTDSPAYVLPVIFTAAYQTKQYGQENSIYSVGASPSVFAYLANPPTTGVAAEDAGDDVAETVGAAAAALDTTAATLGSLDVATAHAATTYQRRVPVKNILKDATRHRDAMADFYDAASVYRP